eukprot:TRINITY_DN4247_c1_g1_i1.p1 TRINITY_DN4247_c1_g1~~TRINITY_DN4247_c1_g1_i1.p1  ORF type:complete len:434 (+),score=78.33 TRINITY_DN4247_c1_g1_i1:45-1346(+)
MGAGASAQKKPTPEEEEAHEEKNAEKEEEEGAVDEDTETADDIKKLSNTELTKLAAEREKESEDRLQTLELDNYWIPIDETERESLTDSDWRPGNDILVTCCTWNMEAKGPPSSLTSFTENSNFHILAVGSQECMRSIQKSFIFSDKEDWEKAVTAHVGDRYTLLESITLVATHLMVFVREDIHTLINKASIAKEKVATGIAGAMGNKGGMGISFIIGQVNSPHSISVLFMCAHFAAHQGAVEDRNKDYKVITSEIKLGLLGNAIHRVVGHEKPKPDRDVTDEFDCTFFMGDLNYRVNGRRDVIIDMLKTSVGREALYRNDQLGIEIRKGTVFPKFCEGTITFPPTYKYLKDSDEYEDKKRRNPSWTDRILFKVTKRRQPIGVSVCSYTAVQNMRESDHRPVRGEFAIKTPMPEVSPFSVKTLVPESSACVLM